MASSVVRGARTRMNRGPRSGQHPWAVCRDSYGMLEVRRRRSISSHDRPAVVKASRQTLNSCLDVAMPRLNGHELGINRLRSTGDVVVDEDITIVSENERLSQLTVEFPDGVKIEFTGTPGLGMPISLHHVHFFVENGEALRAWYAHTFGAKASMRRIFFSAEFPGGPGFPGPELDFLTGRTGSVPNDGRAIDRIGLEVQGLERLLARLEGEGATIEVPLQERSGLGVRRAVIVDPIGTRIELTEGLSRR